MTEKVLTREERLERDLREHAEDVRRASADNEEFILYGKNFRTQDYGFITPPTTKELTKKERLERDLREYAEDVRRACADHESFCIYGKC